MSKTSKWVLDLEEKFFDIAEKLIKESEVLQQAITKVEIIRQLEYPWMDASDVQEAVTEVWNDVNKGVL